DGTVARRVLPKLFSALPGGRWSLYCWCGIAGQSHCYRWTLLPTGGCVNQWSRQHLQLQDVLSRVRVMRIYQSITAVTSIAADGIMSDAAHGFNAVLEDENGPVTRLTMIQRPVGATDDAAGRPPVAPMDCLHLTTDVRSQRGTHSLGL